MELTEKIISTPYVGGKKLRIKEIRKIIKDNGYKRIFDAFGGSCCISANLVYNLGFENVFTNDYDCFTKKFNYLNKARIELEKEIRASGIFENTNRKKQMTEETKKEFFTILYKVLEKYPNINKWQLGRDYLYSSLLPSITLEDNNNRIFEKQSFFVITRKDEYYKEQEHYGEVLEKLNTSHKDYKEFLKSFEYQEKDLIILDPPYLNSEQKTYNKAFFGIKQTIEMLKILKELKTDFILFCQKAEDIEEIVKLLGFAKWEIYKKEQAIYKNEKGHSKREDNLFLIKF